MKKKFAKLVVSYSYDYTLIAIYTSTKDFKLCYELNKELNINLSRSNDLVIPTKKSLKKSKVAINQLFSNDLEVENSFPVFQYENDDNIRFYTLIGNRNGLNALIPEMNKVDFWFLIQESLNENDLESLVTSLKRIKAINTFLEIDINNLPSKQNFIL